MKRVMCLYPEDYASMLRVAQEEIDADARPALATQVENMDEYDVVFVGYPIWHGRMPQAIYSFIESHDLTGKTVISFNTHEGSGQSGTQQVIEAALPSSTVLQGLAIQGKVAQEDPERTRALIEPWLEGMNMRKANTGAEAEVLAAYEAIQQAMIDKDIETLDRLYRDGTTFTHMSGKVQTKAEFFGEIADGTLNYYAYEIRNLHITVDGGEAILTASVTLTAKVYGEFINDLDPSTVHFPRAESIRGGEVIDLGEKKLSVVEIPGHTAGSIMLLDPDEKICFSGDAIIEHLWMFLEESLPPEVYWQSLQHAVARLREAGIRRTINGCPKYMIPSAPAMIPAN